MDPLEADEHAHALRRVLVVDAAPVDRQRLRDFFAEHDYAVQTAETLVAATVALRTFAPHAVVIDPQLPDRDGWMLPTLARGLRPDPMPVFIAVPRAPSAAEMARAEAWGYAACFGKPCELAQILRAVALGCDRTAGRSAPTA